MRVSRFIHVYTYTPIHVYIYSRPHEYILEEERQNAYKEEDHYFKKGGMEGDEG